MFLRPILACKWIERNLGPVPTEFEKLVEAIVEDNNLKSAINNLLVKKRAAEELSWGNRVPAISDFITIEIDRLRGRDFNLEKNHPDINELNKFFRSVLQEVWKK